MPNHPHLLVRKIRACSTAADAYVYINTAGKRQRKGEKEPVELGTYSFSVVYVFLQFLFLPWTIANISWDQFCKLNIKTAVRHTHSVRLCVSFGGHVQ